MRTFFCVSLPKAALLCSALILSSCATNAQRESKRDQIDALRSLTPIRETSPTANPSPGQPASETSRSKDSDLIRALEQLQPLSDVRWIKPVRPSIQILARKGAEPIYNLSDLSLAGDLENASNFFKTHEVIFWLKGSLEFSSFGKRKKSKQPAPNLPWSEPTPLPGNHRPLYSIIRPPYPRKTYPPDEWRTLIGGEIDRARMRALAN